MAESGNLRITVEKNISETRLSQLCIQSWPKWGCGPGKYQFKYDALETCYLLKGRVKAYLRNMKNKKPEEEEEEFVEFERGDLVIIPKGISCTWDVSVAVDKYYKFDSPSADQSSSS